mgnify:CR=1 FL=1
MKKDEILENDIYWDEKLNIRTSVSDYAEEDDLNYGYDPTPYLVLEEIIKLDCLKESDVLVDYGCGKGRLSFFFNNELGCKVIGIDHSRRLLKKAKKNLENYGKTSKIEFIHSKAEEYIPPDNANRFYFFNPFSSKIFSKVLKNIEESYDKNPREILIFFYYSTIEYKLYLQTEPHLELLKGIEFDGKYVADEGIARLDVFKFK